MTTNVVIIGAYGSAGVAAAQDLADKPDTELTLVDDGDPGGGLCILRGCMPSKEVLSAGAHRYHARHDDRLGSPPAIDLDAVVGRKNDQTLTFAEHRREAVHTLADRENVEFIHDTVRFVDDDTITVGDRTIEADYVVVATGSTVNAPDNLTGIDEVGYMDSTDVLDATDLPETGVAVGFGAVGVELVPYLCEAGGMDLTVIDPRPRPLDQADEEFGNRLLDLYHEQFDVEILSGAEAHAVERVDSDNTRVHIEQDGRDESVEADQLFLFTGRRPDLDGLGLANTSLDPGPGWVNDTMQASADPRTFIVGDANGRTPILHVAKEQGFLAAVNILAHSRDEDLDPYEYTTNRVLFTGLGVVPFARVGHTEESAAKAGYDSVAISREASDDGVFKTKDVPYGLAKLVVDADDGTVLGYQGLHFHADVMAKTMQVIVRGEMDVREVPDRAYHPTTPEILDGLFREATEALSEES
jgi:pyruvate/2-oxoglutarate dehydrogenase complex dihydrolipoamide dehydrogenase (E3) component